MNLVFHISENGSEIKLFISYVYYIYILCYVTLCYKLRIYVKIRKLLNWQRIIKLKLHLILAKGPRSDTLAGNDNFYPPHIGVCAHDEYFHE